MHTYSAIASEIRLNIRNKKAVTNVSPLMSRRSNMCLTFAEFPTEQTGWGRHHKHPQKHVIIRVRPDPSRQRSFQDSDPSRPKLGKSQAGHGPEGTKTCHFCKRATSVPLEGPAYGLDFARHCEFPLRAGAEVARLWKWHVWCRLNGHKPEVAQALLSPPPRSASSRRHGRYGEDSF